jgi:large subunit ribosomal protein L10
MKKRGDKENEVQSLHHVLEQSQNVFVTGFNKLTVAQDYELRKAVRGAGGSYRVIKNTLAAKAAEGTPAEGILKNVAGMTALACTAGDPVALAKALIEYAKANPSLTFRAGLVQGRAVDVAAIVSLASLPPREEIFARLLYLIRAPATRLTQALSGVGRTLAGVIDQGCRQNKFSA